MLSVRPRGRPWRGVGGSPMTREALTYVFGWCRLRSTFGHVNVLPTFKDSVKAFKPSLQILDQIVRVVQANMNT